MTAIGAVRILGSLLLTLRYVVSVNMVQREINIQDSECLLVRCLACPNNFVERFSDCGRNINQFKYLRRLEGGTSVSFNAKKKSVP